MGQSLRLRHPDPAPLVCLSLVLSSDSKDEDPVQTVPRSCGPVQQGDTGRVNLTPSLSFSLCMVLASCSHCCRVLNANQLTGTIFSSICPLVRPPSRFVISTATISPARCRAALLNFAVLHAPETAIIVASLIRCSQSGRCQTVFAVTSARPRR